MSKIDLILNILIIILGIIFIFLIINYGVGACDKIKYNYNNISLNAEEFMDLYSQICLDKKFEINYNSTLKPLFE